MSAAVQARTASIGEATMAVSMPELVSTVSDPIMHAETTSTTARSRPARRRGGGGRFRGGIANGRQHTHGIGSTHSQADIIANPSVTSTPQSESTSRTAQGESSRFRRGPRGRGGSGSPDDTRARGRHGRGGAGGAGGGRGGHSSMRATTTVVGGHTFEGRLTLPGRASEEDDGVAADEAALIDQGLRADAPAFVPGQTSALERPSTASRRVEAANNSKVRTKARPVQEKPQKNTTKSTAPDIATRTHEDIANNLYECPICTGELGRRSRVWSCGLCWTVFHLSCVKKWSKNEGSAAAQDAARRQQEEEAGTGIGTISPRAWRCPGCNLAQEVQPTTYSCWCEKEVDPRPLPGLPPHSCGQTCSRARKSCPHPCDATCHAGPCAPCTAMGPTQDCFCGRKSSTKRCQDTDYEHGWSCGQICGDLLPCGEHTCTRPCHEGLCGSCVVKVEAKCYCGKVETVLLCSARDEELESRKMRDDLHPTSEVDEWTGSFGCGDNCHRAFDCGKHFCEKTCHPQDAKPAHCPRSPDTVTHCPCGKTRLEDVPGFIPRTTCEDPIPNCHEACGKILPCGHSCDQVCHVGSCGPCLRTVPVQCRCGRSTSMTICHQGVIEPPQCFRQCKTTLHCGRHACTDRCCSGEQKAIERQALRRKLKPHLRPSDDDIEAEHICTRVCGRTLKCGRHTCPELCHKGACNTCREAIFEEISCNCGRTVLYPPLPCGTQPPPCTYPCLRPKVCGHPQTAHNCHPDDEECPKCPFLTEKTCLCGKTVLKNQPCWLTDARCGQICGGPLKCGSHFCQKNCHRPGQCEDVVSPCQQRCGKSKTICGHPCSDPCHAPYPCPEKTPCTTMVAVTCACGRLRQERRCNAAKAVTSKGQVQQPQRLPALTPLSCDEECARLERNRSLASALGVNIDPSTTTSKIAPQPLSSTNLPYSNETLDMYIQLSSSSPLSTLQNYEETLHSLATSTTQRSVRFQPAKSQLRAFVHSLATDWGFATESFDPEPHRHVFVLKPTSWTPPVFGMGRTGTGTGPAAVGIGIGGMSVGECVKVRERHRFKEREAQRLAAAEAKAAKESSRLQGEEGSGADGGWAQVASRSRKPDGARPLTPLVASGSMAGPFSRTTMYAALAADGSAWAAGQASSSATGAKKERLVLRSGVGAGKQLKAQSVSAPAAAVDADVADDWEEAEEKVEQEERKLEDEKEHEHSQDVHGDGGVESSTPAGVEASADAAAVTPVAE